jgi:ABC-type molybdate transport system substrate-binding protein
MTVYKKNSIYRTVSVLVRGNSPTDKIRITGEYINYSVTVLKNAVNTRGAINFLEFMLGPAGMNIFRKCGQDPLIPASTGQPDKIPAELTKYLKSK